MLLHPYNQEMYLELDIEPKDKDLSFIKDFISKFDGGKDVKPFNMEFQVIQ